MKVPLKRTLVLLVLAAATDVDRSDILGEAPFDGTISAVGYIPNAAITGANTNTRKVAVTNRGLGGLGTTEVAGLQFNSGVNAVKWDKKAVTLSVTPADLEVAAGDVLTFDTTAPGTGIADPGGLLIVEITRSDA